MPTFSDFPARGMIIDVREKMVVFQPENTTYELYLLTEQPYDGPINRPIDGLIHVTARKVWTVQGGGLWVAPITGTPRIVQGRVRHIEGNQIVVHAGTSYIVDLPEKDMAMSLLTGQVAVNRMINIVVLPGARFEPLVAAGV